MVSLRIFAALCSLAVASADTTAAAKVTTAAPVAVTTVAPVAVVTLAPVAAITFAPVAAITLVPVATTVAAKATTVAAVVATVAPVAAAAGADAFTYGQWSAVYNALSFGIAGMGAACVFAFFQHFNVSKKYRTALIINGLVTFIATYHYFRIFNSWNDAFTVGEAANGIDYEVTKTGKPFNDAYRYVDWLLTVPLLLAELVLVMGLPDDQTRTLTWKLGLSSAIMVGLGYPGEISSVATTRWCFWGASMIPFLYIVYTLLVGLAPRAARDPEDSEEEADVENYYPFLAGDEAAQARLNTLMSSARYLTVVSWLTYPIVYAIKSADVASAAATTAEQVGYSLADFLAKAVFGILIWAIASTKSDIEEATAAAKM